MGTWKIIFLQGPLPVRLHEGGQLGIEPKQNGRRLNHHELREKDSVMGFGGSSFDRRLWGCHVCGFLRVLQSMRWALQAAQIRISRISPWKCAGALWISPPTNMEPDRGVPLKGPQIAKPQVPCEKGGRLRIYFLSGTRWCCAALSSGGC